jgi:hypothetical protein
MFPRPIGGRVDALSVGDASGQGDEIGRLWEQASVSTWINHYDDQSRT